MRYWYRAKSFDFFVCRSGAIDRAESSNKQNNKKTPQNEEISGKAQLPQHVTNYQNDSKEATPEEITRVYNRIRRIHYGKFAEVFSIIDSF